VEQLDHEHGPLEFGRGPRREVPRVVIDDDAVSRDQLRIDRLPNGWIRVDNLSSRKTVVVAGSGFVATGQSRDLQLPLHLIVGRTRVTIDSVGSARESQHTPAQQTHAPGVSRDHPGTGPGVPDDASLLTALSAASSPDESPDAAGAGLVALESPIEGTRRSGLTSGSSPGAGTIDQLAEWLHTIVELQQAAPGTREFFQGTAQAMLDLAGMDLGIVLLARGQGWEVAAATGADDGEGGRYSRTLVEYAARNRQTFYQDLERMAQSTLSLARIEAAVAAPIFGLRGEVAGVLYGARSRGLFARGPVGPIEAQLVQLLSAAVGANLARTTALRTRVQFEQFFSPELVQELEQNPNLLEGRSQEVTVVFTDLRGFTALSQRLGAEPSFRIVRDLMEGLSEHIVAHGGVIVDYAGDGILAMWNAPTAQPDHAERACRAALAMLGVLPRINERWGQEAGNALSLGIGINSGQAQVGNTGSSRKFKYGPHGLTVNVASRVQDATKVLGLPLLVTEAVRHQLPAAIHTRRLGQVRLPGVEVPVVLYELRGENPPEDWLRLRESYERGLALYEAGEWSRACQTVAPLLPSAGDEDQYDVPTLKLLRRAWECLEVRPDPFVPILDVSRK